MLALVLRKRALWPWGLKTETNVPGSFWAAIRKK